MRIPASFALALVLAGCFAGGADDGPTPAPGLDHGDLMPVAGAESDRDGRNLTHVWTGDLGAGAEVPLVNGALLGQYASADHAVLVDESVQTLTLTLEGAGVSAAFLRDADSHLMCVARVGRTCATAVRANATQEWPIRVVSLDPLEAEYALTATLSPDPPALGADPTPLAHGFTVHRSEEEGGEPTLAVTRDDRIIVVAGTSVLRLEPDGSFTDVTPPVEAALDQTLDPFVYGDDRMGRIYVTQLSQCLRVWWTDDAGESWAGNPHVCAGPEQHHQKVAVGPGPLDDAPGFVPSPRAIHIATMNLASWLTTDELVVFHTRSLDGGAAWTQNTAKVRDADGTPELRNIGNIATAESPGVVHAVAYVCDRFVDATYGGLAVGRSSDYGATWAWQAIAPGGGRCEGIDPGIWAQGDDVHVAWEDMSAGVGHVWWAQSRDGGVTWDDPMPIPTPGLGSFAFTDIAVENGGQAIAFLATPDTTLGPTQAPGWARWFPYVALHELHGWQAYRLQDDPVQLGPICMDGPKCLDGARNLLDFIDVRIDDTLGAVIAYPDGCEGACAWPHESRDAFLRIAILEHPLS